MRRESLKLQESDWRRLDKLAAATRSIYAGKPSWRRMIIRIARGQLTLQGKRSENRLHHPPHKPTQPVDH